MRELFRNFTFAGKAFFRSFFVEFSNMAYGKRY